MKVDEVELLLRHLCAYNSVCICLNLEWISCCFKNTRHLTPTKGRILDETEAPTLNVWRGGLIAQAKHAVHLKGKVAEESLSRAVYVRFFFQIK